MIETTAKIERKYETEQRNANENMLDLNSQGIR
jgi:hypothetical protein